MARINIELRMQVQIVLSVIFGASLAFKAHGTIWWDSDVSDAWGRFYTQGGQDYAENWNLDSTAGGANEDPLLSLLNNGNDLVFSVESLTSNTAIRLSTANFPAPYAEGTQEYYRRAYSLTFQRAGNKTIEPGSLPTELRLGAGGIHVASNSGPVSINAPLDLTASQIWDVHESLTVNGNLSLSGSDLTIQGGDDTTINGNILNTTGRIIKNGSHTLTLSGNNSYTGGTTIDRGKLVVNGSVLGQVDVNVGGTLGGSGTIGGSVSSNGRVAPGNSPGILTINGNYTLNNASTLEIEIGALTPGPGPPENPDAGHDQVQVGGVATLAGRLEVPIINNFEPIVGQEVEFLTAGVALNGNFQTVVSPNLFDVDPTIGIVAIASTVNKNARIRFIEVTDDVAFTAISDEADWSAAGTWSVATGPTEENNITIQNLYDDDPQQVSLQRVEVTTDIAPVNHLNITDAFDPITVSVQNGNILESTTEILIATNAAIELGQPATLDTGSLSAATVSILNGGELSGNGTVAAKLVVEDGIVNPGFSVGRLDVQGNYEQRAEGTLRVDVESATQRDLIDVTGSVQLGGTLQIDASNVVSLPIPHNTFEILTAGSLNGAFNTVETVGNDAVYFNVIYDYVNGSVSASGHFYGDMNGNGVRFDDDDFELFAFGLTNIHKLNDVVGTEKFFLKCEELGDENTPCNVLPQQGGDFSRNGRLDFDDIAGFQQSLASAGISDAGLIAALNRYFNNVPEPSSAVLFICGIFMHLVGVRHRPRVERRFLQVAVDGGVSELT